MVARQYQLPAYTSPVLAAPPNSVTSFLSSSETRPTDSPIAWHPVHGARRSLSPAPKRATLESTLSRTESFGPAYTALRHQGRPAQAKYAVDATPGSAALAAHPPVILLTPALINSPSYARDLSR